MTKIIATALSAIVLSGCARKEPVEIEKIQTYRVVVSQPSAAKAFAEAKVRAKPQLIAAISDYDPKPRSAEVLLLPIGKSQATASLHRRLAQSGDLKGADALMLAEFVRQHPKVPGSFVTLHRVRMPGAADVYLYTSADTENKELRGKNVDEADVEGWNKKGYAGVYLLAVK